MGDPPPPFRFLFPCAIPSLPASPIRQPLFHCPGYLPSPPPTPPPPPLTAQCAQQCQTYRRARNPETFATRESNRILVEETIRIRNFSKPRKDIGLKDRTERNDCSMEAMQRVQRCGSKYGKYGKERVARGSGTHPPPCHE